MIKQFYKGFEVEAEIREDKIILKKVVKNNIKVSTKDLCNFQSDQQLLSILKETPIEAS
jgi:hypothetical protein